jgi:mobilome CxxCx(11)CxxC protein
VQAVVDKGNLNKNKKMTDQEKTDKIKLESSDKAFHAFGYSYIFTKRIKWYLRYINALKFFGIIVPLTVGALAIGYEFKHDILVISIGIAIPATILQLILSTLSIVYKWDDELAYAFEANQDYNHLYDDYTKLYKFPPLSIIELEKQFEVLNAKQKNRETQDSKHDLTEKELRMGMRYSLREHKKECAGCKLVPTTMEATKCGVCGNF